MVEERRKNLLVIAYLTKEIPDSLVGLLEKLVNHLSKSSYRLS
jgi:hypothetical protein